MQVYRPFGLMFCNTLSGTFLNAVRAFATRNGPTCPALHKGAPVRLQAGHVVSVGTDPSGAWLGVVAGVAYVDSYGPKFANFLPAGTSSMGPIDGDNRPQVYVVADPDATFWIQANASVSAGDVGLNFNVTTLGESDLFGQSRYGLMATTRTTANTAPLKIVGLARVPDNAWDNPFPIVEVKMNMPILTTLSAAL